MKISAKQYALSLWESLKEKDEKERPEVIRNFVSLLIKKKQTKLLSRITKALKEIEKEEEGFIEAEIRAAHKVSEDEKNLVTKFLKDFFGDKKIILETKEDASVIGGVIVSCEGNVWDLSVSGGLKKLEKSLK